MPHVKICQILILVMYCAGQASAVEIDVYGEWSSAVDAGGIQNNVESLQHISGGITVYWNDWFGTRASIDGYRMEFEHDIAERAGGVSISAILRKRLWGDAFAIYLAGDLGILQASGYTPDVGTKFNFTERVRVGATLDVTDELWIDLGGRYVHMSNAGFGGRDNPGIDYLGVSFGAGVRF